MARNINGRNWGADCAISMPQPLHPSYVTHVDMGGFCFTQFGIAQNFRETDLEAYRPTYAPPPEITLRDAP
jgi:hypothetical protein